MPDGRLQRIDEAKGEIHVVRRGREYLATPSNVESRARVPGARVHFDIVRRDGVEYAENVRLAVGTRTNKRHRRFGDLTGAHRPGAKVRTTSAELLGVDVSTQPVQVVRAWVEATTAGDADGALSLYAPDALIHTATQTYSGRMRLKAFMDEWGPRNVTSSDVSITGADQLVRTDWPREARFGAKGGDDPDDQASCWFEVDRGHIIEQWHGVEPDTDGPDEGQAGPSIDLVVEGPVHDRELALVRDRLTKLMDSATQPVRSARCKISVIDHATERPVSASASIDINGTVVRAHVGAREVSEALDALTLRLRRQIGQVTDHHRRKTLTKEKFASWHHGDPPAARPDAFDRDPDDRALVRHKSYTTDLASIEEALWDMYSLDYDFFLFTEVSTGVDCLLATTEDGVALHPKVMTPAIDATDAVGRVETVAAPILSVSEAIARLSAGNERFVFFDNRSTGRGNVLYLRYDGHYGLITPPNGDATG